MSNIPRIPHDEQVFRAGSIKLGLKVLLHVEQKNMLWIQDIMRKFTLPGGEVVDFCVATFPLVMSSMLLPQHRRFGGCDLYSEGVSSRLSQLALVLPGKS